MERNIDRNLRMARREARRFFGVNGRGLGRSGVYLIAMLITFAGFHLVEPYVKHFQLFQDGLGWFLLIGMFAVSTLIFFLMERGFGVHLWEGLNTNSIVVNALVNRRAELAGDIENTHETKRKMVLDLENLDATIVQRPM